MQIVDCSQVINVIQGQYGDATAIGRRAVAVIANEQGVTVNQVNACLGNVGDEETTDEETTDEETTDEETTEETTDEETTVVRGETVIVPDKLSDTTLPETGGPGGYVLAAGCALLGVGLILNRIAR